MKVFLVITALILSAGMVKAEDATIDSADLDKAAARIGDLKKALAIEKAAVDKAVKEKSDSVTFSKDAYHALLETFGAYGAGYVFLNKTIIPPTVATYWKKSSNVTTPAVVEAVAPEEKLAKVSGATKAATYTRTVGSYLWSTAFGVATVGLTILAAGDLYDSGQDFYIKNFDNDSIRAQRAEISKAQAELDATEDNLHVAAAQIVANKM